VVCLPWPLPVRSLLARMCRNNHVHLAVKGESATRGLPHTREAQAYAPRLCKAWAYVVLGAYHGWAPDKLKPVMNEDGHSADYSGLAKPQEEEGTKCGELLCAGLGVILKPLGAPRPSEVTETLQELLPCAGLGVILKPLGAPRPFEVTEALQEHEESDCSGIEAPIFRHWPECLVPGCRKKTRLTCQHCSLPVCGRCKPAHERNCDDRFQSHEGHKECEEKVGGNPETSGLELILKPLGAPRPSEVYGAWHGWGWS
jgi:hypothetical protein